MTDIGEVLPYLPSAAPSAAAEIYVRLKAGETFTGGYNSGRLASEVITGSYPNVTATATVISPDSPLHGATVPLMETMENQHLAQYARIA